MEWIAPKAEAGSPPGRAPADVAGEGKGWPRYGNLFVQIHRIATMNSKEHYEYIG